MKSFRFVSGVDPNTRVVDTSAKVENVNPKVVEAAFGARPIGKSAGLDLFAIREAMGRMLQSSGGRPSLAGTRAQVKIPKIPGDWEKLKKLSMSTGGVKHRPSTGQVAALLIHLALDRLPQKDLEDIVRQKFV